MYSRIKLSFSRKNWRAICISYLEEILRREPDITNILIFGQKLAVKYQTINRENE